MIVQPVASTAVPPEFASVTTHLPVLVVHAVPVTETWAGPPTSEVLEEVEDWMLWVWEEEALVELDVVAVVLDWLGVDDWKAR